MKSVIIHAGFHKTATTTVQNFFRKNRSAFKSRYRMVTGKPLVSLNLAARSFSADPRSTLKLAEFKDSVNIFFAENLQGKEDGLLISSETLSGHLPGRPTVSTYSAAIPLMSAIEFSLREVFGVENIHFYYSTRRPEKWLPSAYSEHVKSNRMVLSEAEYIEKFAEGANFAPILQAMRETLASQVISNDIDDLDGKPFGSVEPLLEIMGWSEEARTGLELTPSRNRRLPVDIQNQLLEINRSDLDEDAVRKAKRDLIDEYRQGQPL